MTNLLFISGSDDLSVGTILGIIIFFGCYLAICACVGKFAKNRGRSFLLFFILSILNPVLGFIIAALAGESNSFREERIRREVKNALEQERNNQQPQNNQETEEYKIT